jgi:shikimate dehydrogenase
MIDAAYRQHGLDARDLNCEVAPEAPGDAVRGARAMSWVGFNCSIPQKRTVIEHLAGYRRPPRRADGRSALRSPPTA